MENRKFLVIIVLIFLAHILIAFLRGLGEPDEGRYAEIAREMIINKDFITPTLNGIKHFHKPPLIYWMSALSMLVFGINELAARIPIIVFSIAGAVLNGFFAKKLFPEKRDIFLYAVFITATTLQYLIWSNLLCPDLVLSVLVCAAFYFLWEYIEKGKGISLMYAFLGLGFLIKGPVAVILVVLSALIFFMLTGNVKKLKMFFDFKGILLFLIISMPWFLIVSYNNKGLAEYFIDYHLIKRFFSNVHKRGRPFWYFLVVFAAGFLPWIFYLVNFYIKKAKDAFRNEKYLFLSVWLFGVLIFFSFSKSKLPGYILPAYSPAVILTAGFLAEKRIKRWFKSGVVIAAVYFVFVGIVFIFEDSLGNNFSPKRPAKIILKCRKKGDVVVNFRCFIQGLPFYVKDRVVLAQKEREVQFETNLDKNYYIEELKEFINLLKNKRCFVFSPLVDFEELKDKTDLKFNILWEKSGLVLFVNFDASNCGSNK